MRLIDADAIPWDVEGVGEIPVITREEIDEMPTVELIRCKDCKHWSANTQFCSVFSGLCTAHRMPPNGYCSEAKRKEG